MSNYHDTSSPELSKQEIEEIKEHQKIKEYFIVQFMRLAFDNRTTTSLTNGLYIPRNLQYQYGASITEHFKSGQTVTIGIVSTFNNECEIYREVGGESRVFEEISSDEFWTLFKLWTMSDNTVKRMNSSEISTSPDCTIDDDSSSKDWVNSLKDKIEP
jgi:hypothetical protein